MTEKIESWIRVGDETYEDCIVGNREGLGALQEAINDALKNERSSAELANYTDSDVDLVVLAEDHEIKKEAQTLETKLISGFFGTLILCWLVILPVLGIYALIQLFTQ